MKLVHIKTVETGLSLPLDSWDSNLREVDSWIPDSNPEAWIREYQSLHKRYLKGAHIQTDFFKNA